MGEGRKAPFILVGAGQAAARAADALRRQGYEGRIVMFGEEPHQPYQRPPLSKKFLTGDVLAPQLWLQGDGYFEQNGIELFTDARVTAVDPRHSTVMLADGSNHVYDRLLLATGSIARPLPVPGASCSGVYYLRTMADTLRLRGVCEAGHNVVIIGGGYIGLEVAASVRSIGKSVTVVEGQERLLKRVVSPVVSAFFLDLHRRNGVDVRLGATVARIVGDTAVTGVELTGGEAIAADLVLVAIGGAANDELAREARLACDDGVLVDETCHAGYGIYAAGDCARFPSRRYGRLVRLESVQNANDQGRAAAQAMLGKPTSYDPIPWFWSDQFDVKLQIAGLSQGYDRTTQEGDPAKGAFCVSYWQGERLLATDSINAPRSHMEARRALART